MQNFRTPTPPKTLLDAAAWGDLVAAQKFLAKGAKPDQKDAQGWTALHHAVGYGQQSGADVITSRTPVKGLVDALLKAGADLQLADGVGGTALTRALWYEHCSRKFADFLLQKGAPVSLWDALWLGDTTKALALVATANVKTTGPKSYTYLHLAAELGNVPVVERLLAQGAAVNARDKNGYTPLHHAIGGTPGEVLGSGKPYWHAYGPAKGREPLLALLLKSGANRDARGHDTPLPRQYTPLGCAILAERPELMRVLLNAGANPNEKGYDDDPLLFNAIETRNLAVVKVLLDAGADPRRKSTYGTTALETAKSTENPQIFALVKVALQKQERYFSMGIFPKKSDKP